MKLKWIVVVVLLAGIGGAVLEIGRQVHIPDKLVDLANTLNKELPQNVDSETRLERVTAREFELDLRYTLINYRANDIHDVQGLNAEIAAMLQRNNCNLIEDLSHDMVAFNANFFGNDGAPISTVTIRRSDCG